MMLSRPVSRLAALALLFAFCWALTTLWAIPLGHFIAGERADAANARGLLARYRQLESSLPSLQRQLDILRTSADGKAFLLGKSPSLMAAEMQGVAQKLVSSAGVTLHSSRTLPAAVEEGFDRIGVDLDMSGSTAALMTLLYDVEAAEPAIFVERLTVQVPESGVGVRAADGQPLLNVRLRLNSYAQIVTAKMGPK